MLPGLPYKLPIAKDGLPFIISGICLTVFLFSIGLTWGGYLLAVLSLFVVCFFRDPPRKTPSMAGGVFAPADGKICQILYIDHNRNPLGEKAVRISTFMSIFNVHVNRVPVTGTILKISYRKGRFFSANLDKASEKNESNTIILQTEGHEKVVFVQIAGLIARRIVCRIREGERIRAGLRFGLIRFGSRVDLFLPYESSVFVPLHGKVKAGETVIASLLRDREESPEKGNENNRRAV